MDADDKQSLGDQCSHHAPRDVSPQANGHTPHRGRKTSIQRGLLSHNSPAAKHHAERDDYTAARQNIVRVTAKFAANMKENEQVGKLWWAVPAATILLLAMLAMIFGNPEQRQPGTSYDASPNGFRAAYLLLDELGYPVTRARRLGGPEIRWLLFPAKATPNDAKRLDEWVRAGGVLLFADYTDEFAGQMGIQLKIETLKDADDEAMVRGLVAKGERLAGGKTWTNWPGQNGNVLARAGGKPLITVYRHGQGQIWLVQRPEFVSNELMRKADNGVVLCRLVEAMLADKPGQIAFDEYFHGMRDRPSVTALLLQRPASWGTYHGLLLMAVLLWHYVPRFGAVRPVPGPHGDLSRNSWMPWLRCWTASATTRPPGSPCERPSCGNLSVFWVCPRIRRWSRSS